MMRTAKEVADYVSSNVKVKTSKSFKDLLLEAFLAGAFISLGGIGYFKLVGIVEDPGIGLFLGALIFPVGIMGVLFIPGELFTSDCLSFIGLFKGELSIKKVLRLLVIVWIFNLIGTIFISFLVAKAGIMPQSAKDVLFTVVDRKSNLSVEELIYSSILCNFIVSSAVWMTYAAKDAISKLWMIWFPIALFVISGTEHSIANMFFFFSAKMQGSEITFGQIFYNLGFVTIGNMIGGGIIVAGVHYLIHYKNNIIKE